MDVNTVFHSTDGLSLGYKQPLYVLDDEPVIDLAGYLV
jgi:hypothetical protein